MALKSIQYQSNPTIWLKNSGTVNKILSDTLNLSYFAYNKIRQNHYIPNISPEMNPYIDGLAGPYLMHEAKYYTPVTYPNAGYNNFEDISNYPEFVKVAVCYDKLPKKVGNIWENMPSIEAINKLAPKDALTNLKGQKSAIAYRDNATDPFHYVFFSYDARGRIEAIIRWTENIGFDVVHYTYNSMNKINSVTAIDAIRQFTTWNVYDNNGRIWKVYTRLGNTNTGFGHSADTINFANVDFPEPLVRPYLPDITYNYNKRGGVDTVKYPASNVVKSFIYNPRGWVEEILAKKGTNDILFYQVLQRDAMGNVTQQTSKHRDPLIKASIYQYDTLNRLKEWTYNGGNNYEQYEYDDIGNRLSVNRSGSTDEYLYTGGNNKLYAVNLDGGKVRHLTYNNYGAATEIWETNNGTITKQEFWEYVNSTIPKRYRKENKDNSFNTLTYTNDMRNFNEWDWGYRRGAFDAREQKRLMKSPHGDGSVFANHTETDYIHSWEYSLTGAGGEELILYKGIQTVTSITLPAPNNTKTDAGRRVYIAPYKYYGAGGEVQIKANGEKEIHITDNLGSVRCIIIGDGTNIRSYDYKPFGELEWSSDNKTERKGFANAEYDGESSYFAMGIRMYSAEMGRFLAVDPMFEAMPRHTPYHYSFNSPLVYCDPSGLVPISICNVPDNTQEVIATNSYDFANEIERSNNEAWRIYSTIDGKPHGVGSSSSGTDWIGFLRASLWGVGRLIDLHLSGSGEQGDGNNGATATFQFDWYGKAVYVKYNPNDISEDDLKEKVSGLLEDIASADKENVIASQSDFCFDFSMSSAELFTFYYNQCQEELDEYRANHGTVYDYMSAFTSNIWYSKGGSNSGCKSNGKDETSFGWTYFASDYIKGNLDVLSRGFSYEYRVIGSNSWFNSNWSNRIAMPLLMVASHELKHRYDSMFHGGNYITESSANGFMFDVMQYYYPNLEFRR